MSHLIAAHANCWASTSCNFRAAMTGFRKTGGYGVALAVLAVAGIVRAVRRRGRQ